MYSVRTSCVIYCAHITLNITFLPAWVGVQEGGKSNDLIGKQLPRCNKEICSFIIVKKNIKIKFYACLVNATIISTQKTVHIN